MKVQPFQPKLTDYSEGLLSEQKEQKKVYPQYVLILQRLADHTPFSEIKCLLGLSKQALNRQLTRLVRKGWVERIDFGVYEPTKQGLKYLDSISGTSKPSAIVGRLPVIEKSVHHFKVRFNLKGSRFDKSGLRKSHKNQWIDYLDSEGVTIVVGKRGLFVQVHGLRGGSALDLARRGVERAREAVLAFCARRGARVYAVGELVQAPHWVLEDKEVSRALIGWLDLREGKTVQAGGLTWFTDKSHAGLVEARGGVSEAVRAFKEFDYLVSGGLKRDLELVKSELASVKIVAREVALLREDLRFKPSGLPRFDVV